MYAEEHRGIKPRIKVFEEEVHNVGQNETTLKKGQR
jgi:hypothetical protein